MQPAPGVTVADRFRLVRPLGQGGMGAVWLAQHTGLDIPCAVKFIHEEAARSGQLRARFEREAKAAAQIRSPHVVQILDHGVWQGVPYIAMELLDGEDLDHRLRRLGVIPPRDMVAIATQVGRALNKAHGVGLIHRDLKPANIFITRDEEQDVAKVLDFGVAKVQQAGVDGSTKTGAVLGTPYYMSPEQARGSKTIDHRSDLWALAVVVYQCLTGQLPFTGDALGDLFVKIIVEPLPVPSQLAQVPPGFDGWWARAAARDPAKRFQTAKDMTDALALALGVTAAAGAEIGSSMASSEAMPTGVRGTVLMRRPSQLTPSGGAQAPQHPSGQPPQQPSAQPPQPSGQPPQQPDAQLPQQPSAQQPHEQPHEPSAQPPQYPSGQSPQDQSGLQQAIAVHLVPRSGRGRQVAGALAVAVVAGGVGAFVAFGSGRTDARPATTGVPPSATTAAPTDSVAAPTEATAPPPMASDAPTSKPSTAPIATASAQDHGPTNSPPTGASANTPPGGRRNKNWGF